MLIMLASFRVSESDELFVLPAIHAGCQLPCSSSTVFTEEVPLESQSCTTENDNHNFWSRGSEHCFKGSPCYQCVVWLCNVSGVLTSNQAALRTYKSKKQPLAISLVSGSSCIVQTETPRISKPRVILISFGCLSKHVALLPTISCNFGLTVLIICGLGL